MKRKNTIDNETLAKLEKTVDRLCEIAEKLAEATQQSKQQMQELNEAIALAEDVLRRNAKPGETLEDEEHQMGKPLYIQPPEGVEDDPDDGCERVNFGFGHFVEFSSYEELKKFQQMSPISGDDIENCDFDALINEILAKNGSGNQM